MTDHPATISPGGPVLVRLALAMAARGWHVFPCAPGAKQPALRGNWQLQATTDPARIRRWWARQPYNIGIACGPSMLVVLDLDVSHATPAPGKPGEGTDTLAALCQQHGQPYPSGTYTVQTPSGGWHLYFRAPAGNRIRNSAGRLGHLIDVRTDGAYVIGAGSQAGERSYTVRDTTAPAPFPSWIAALLETPLEPAAATRPVTAGRRGTAYATAALRSETQRVATAPEGTRNNTLNIAAFNLGQLVSAGHLPAAQAHTALAGAAADAGLPADEARRTICSGMTAGARSPRTARHNPST